MLKMIKTVLSLILACIIIVGVFGFINYKKSYMYDMIEARRAQLILSEDRKLFFGELTSEELDELEAITTSGITAAYLYDLESEDSKNSLKYKLNDIFAKVHYILRVLPRESLNQ